MVQLLQIKRRRPFTKEEIATVVRVGRRGGGAEEKGWREIGNKRGDEAKRREPLSFPSPTLIFSPSS